MRLSGCRSACRREESGSVGRKVEVKYSFGLWAINLASVFACVFGNVNCMILRMLSLERCSNRRASIVGLCAELRALHSSCASRRLDLRLKQHK